MPRKAGEKSKEEWFDRLSHRQNSPGVRTAKYFGPQAIEGGQNLIERRLREGKPQLQGDNPVRSAAMRMADHAMEKPLPTKRPRTMNGITMTETKRQEFKDYRAWRADLEQQAIAEVRKELESTAHNGKLSATLRRRFDREVPKPTGGVAGDWRPALW